MAALNNYFLKSSLYLLLLIMSPIFISSSVMALDEAEYVPSSKILTIPSVKIDDIYVYNARLQLNANGHFVILAYSETPPTSGDVASQCTQDLITLEKFNQIVIGMSLDQVNIIIGCEGDFESAGNTTSSYIWTENITTTASISITFVNNVVYSKAF